MTMMLVLYTTIFLSQPHTPSQDGLEMDQFKQAAGFFISKPSAFNTIVQVLQ